MFYKLEHPSPGIWQYAFEDLAFAGFAKAACPECRRERAAAQYSGEHCLLLEGGPRYPDHLPFCGAGGPMMVLSRRAVEVFQEHGITGIGETEPVRAMKPGGAVLPQTAPEYHLVTVAGRIGLDLGQMCLKKKKLCPNCGGFEWNRQRLPRLCVDEQAWDGSALCRVTDIPGYVVCTEAVVSLVKKHRLRGFAFEPL